MSLEALDRETEASTLLIKMRAYAEQQMGKEAKIDYFATSLPNLLLFEDELQRRNQLDNLFVLALAELGLRNPERAKELLNQVLALDCNHIAAQVELHSLTRASDATTLRR
jgi:hypothetical protein